LQSCQVSLKKVAKRPIAFSSDFPLSWFVHVANLRHSETVSMTGDSRVQKSVMIVVFVLALPCLHLLIHARPRRRARHLLPSFQPDAVTLDARECANAGEIARHPRFWSRLG
jgi:hypothetical protein